MTLTSLYVSCICLLKLDNFKIVMSSVLHGPPACRYGVVGEMHLDGEE